MSASRRDTPEMRPRCGRDADEMRTRCAREICESRSTPSTCQDSEHICGVLDKSILGGGTKSGLFSVLLRDHSAAAAAQCMERVARLTSRYLADTGFSIGVTDVQPTVRPA